MRFANGNEFEGQLRAGLPHGHGRMVFPSGDVYEGQFEAGMTHGQGKYAWTSGERYDGAWRGAASTAPASTTGPAATAGKAGSSTTNARRTVSSSARTIPPAGEARCASCLLRWHRRGCTRRAVQSASLNRRPHGARAVGVGERETEQVFPAMRDTHDRISGPHDGARRSRKQFRRSA
jgi:hypothetical protein